MALLGKAPRKLGKIKSQSSFLLRRENKFAQKAKERGFKKVNNWPQSFRVSKNKVPQEFNQKFVNLPLEREGLNLEKPG